MTSPVTPDEQTEIGYRGATACAAAGISYRQLDYWARTGLLEPSVRTACAGTEVNFTAKNSSKNGSYLWNFGDGTEFSSTTRGAPFPNQSITHTYTRTGSYTASLQITWGGTWKASGATSAVSGGAIVQTLYTEVNVVSAPSKYLN